MNVSLAGLLRGIAVMALASSMVAVGLGRLAPRPTNYRLRQVSGYFGLNDYHYSSKDNVTRLLDPESGRMIQMAFPDGETVDCVACSPWRDEYGQMQLVGRWVRRFGSERLCNGYGVARYTFPEGRAIDSVTLNVVPISRPCFNPESPEQILFAAGNGELYRYTFPGASDRSSQGESDGRPSPITWRTTPPGKGPVVIVDPAWPSDPRLHGRLIVSLSYFEPKPGPGRKVMQRAELWWLELNRDGSEIVAAGRLRRSDRAQSPNGAGDDRLASVATTPDGGLVLAYLHQAVGTPGWELRLAPLKIDGETGVPSIEPSESRGLASSLPLSAPTFSADGRWVYVLDELTPTSGHTRRFSVVDELVKANFADNRLALENGLLVQR